MCRIIIAATVFWFLVAMFFTKRLPSHEKWASFWFTAAFAWFFDIAVGLMADLYDYGRTPKVDLEDLISIPITNPSIALIYLNFLPNTTIRRVVYTVVWMAFLLFHEWVWVKLGLMKNKGWNLWLSLLVYPLIFLVVVYQLKWYRRLVKKAAG